MTRVASTALRSTADLRPVNQIALEITGRDYLSWSQVDQMRRCPRKFAFRYVEQETPAFVPSSLQFGTAIHAAIEHHLRQQLEGQPAEKQRLLEVFRESWSEELPGAGVPIRFNQNETEESLFEQAERMIGAYLDSELASLPGRLIAVEESLRGEIDPDLPDVLARVDAVWQDDEGLHVIDFKTSRSRWADDKARENADQLLLYHHLAQRYADELGLPVKLHFGVIGKQKTPSVQRIETDSAPARLQQVLETIQQVWHSILAGSHYANPSPMNCSTCPYKAACPAWV